VTTSAETTAAAGVEAPAPAAAAVWRSPALRRLFTASTTARLANESARVAMVLLVLERGGSPALAGGVVAASTLPALVSGPLLGAWLDRTPRRRLAFVANQLLLLGSLLGLLAATGRAPAWTVLLLGLLGGLTIPVLTGGFTGLIAPLVPRGSIRKAYGAEATSYNVAGVGGPALAGALASGAGADTAVAVTAGLSALALVAVLRVPMPAPEAAPGQVSLARTVGAGLRLLATAPPLRAVTLATTVSFLGIGALPVVFPLLAVDLGAGRAASGLLFATFALGALLGSVVVAAHHVRTGPLRSALAGIAALAVLFAGVAVAPSLPVALGLLLLAGAVEGPVLAATLTVRDNASPADMRTQVVTTASSLKFGAYAIGSALTGTVVTSAGPRAGMAVCAVAQLVGLGLGVLGVRGTPRSG